MMKRKIKCLIGWMSYLAKKAKPLFLYLKRLKIRLKSLTQRLSGSLIFSLSVRLRRKNIPREKRACSTKRKI
ncbi:MAG: hypothetical protein AABY28_06815 [Candidatus Omnitrophota bacterium]